MGTELANCDQKGSEMSLYYDTADDDGLSTCASATWLLNKAVTGDLNLNLTEDKQEQSSREPNRAFKEYGEDKGDLEITGELFIDRGYDGFNYMNAMRNTGKPRNILAMSTYITNVGAIGYKGKFRNFDFSMAGPESGPPRQQFSLAPAACVVDACRVQTVEILVASTVVTYDPTTWAIASVVDYSEILGSRWYRGLTNNDAEEIFTDVGTVIKYLGVAATDDLITSLVEVRRLGPVDPRSARRDKDKKFGIAGFDRAALVKALDERAKNAVPPAKDYVSPAAIKAVKDSKSE